MKRSTLPKEGVSRRKMFKYVGASLATTAIAASSLSAAESYEATSKSTKKPIKLLVHFSDTDYSESVIRNAAVFAGMEAELLMRSFMYIDNDKMIDATFKKVHAHESKNEAIANAQVVVSPCLMTVVQTLSVGGTPVYVKTDDSPADVDTQLKALNVASIHMSEPFTLPV